MIKSFIPLINVTPCKEKPAKKQEVRAKIHVNKLNIYTEWQSISVESNLILVYTSSPSLVIIDQSKFWSFFETKTNKRTMPESGHSGPYFYLNVITASAVQRSTFLRRVKPIPRQADQT